MKRTFSGILSFLLLALPLGFIFAGPTTTSAAVTNWERGANIVPTNTTDFGSASMQQSLRNLKATGANYVALVVPYYQSNAQASDLGPGWNTPTDAALISAINYAHSVGLKVALKVHAESYDGNWRAYINPSDRNTWYGKYNSILTHLGQIGQAHGVEMLVMGVEMVSTASAQVNSNNTVRWQTMIQNVRSVFEGKLTYDANSTNNNSNPFENEKDTIGFWDSLDYASLSIYYNLNTDNSVSSLSGAWSYWNNNDIKGFAERVGKPILFGEIGYRSVDGAHYAPWDSGKPGGYNAQEQVNSYEALLSYWNAYSYVAGIFIWDWKVDPSGGGQANTDYTVQNKPAQTTITKWFTNPSSPGTPGMEPAITLNADANPSGPQVNTNTTVTATVDNKGGVLDKGVIDIEIYNQVGTRVFQYYFEGQTMQTNETRQFPVQWSAATPGTYRVAVGVFSSGWAKNYSWNDNAATITVRGGSNPPPTNPPPATSTPPTNPTEPVSINIWWPTDGSAVSGVQPFKANVDNLDVQQYQMYWQVDDGVLNQMYDSSQDYPHKEAPVDVSPWNWNSNGQYVLTFVVKNAQGTMLSQKSITISV